MDILPAAFRQALAILTPPVVLDNPDGLISHSEGMGVDVVQDSKLWRIIGRHGGIFWPGSRQR